jgi:2-dehydropantoate 2-reductase
MANKFLLIGNGRLSRHFQFFFSQLQISYHVWTRANSLEALKKAVSASSHILLAIPDSALTEFIQKNELANSGKKIIHFSGALEIPQATGIHPLMTFGPDLYDADFYAKIPFVTTSLEPLPSILPGLTNDLFHIEAKDKPYYHSLCVLGGNLTSLLAAKMMSGFSEMGLPENIGHQFLTKALQNVMHDRHKALTGPLARKDFATVDKNLKALEKDPYKKVYEAFLPLTFPEYLEKQNEDSRF